MNPLRMWSWNMGRRRDAWSIISGDETLDVVLLQEACRPQPRSPWKTTPATTEPWRTAGSDRDYCAAIAWRPERVQATPRALGSIESDNRSALRVSRPGTLAVVDVDRGREPLTLVSAYGFWERPWSSRTTPWIYADASVHRLISDISGLVDHPRRHRIIVAGDFNILHGYGEHGNAYWRDRYATVFSRLTALGLEFVGPQSPDGRRPAKMPDELPPDSQDVPTFHTSRQGPAGATRQLDFVFASSSIASRVQTRALNGVEEWGPSDHCRVEIEVE